MKRYLIPALILFLPAVAQAGNMNDWLNKTFAKETGPKPEQTLVAPFADPSVANVAGPSPQTHDSSLNVPHRAARDIAVWAVTAVSDALTFSAGDVGPQIETHRSLFDAQGFAQYQAFIRESGVLNAPGGGPRDLQAFAPQDPVLLNEGAVNGTYRWLFEVPVMVTYQSPGSRDYKQARPESRNFSARVQVGRSAHGGEDGVLIESWSARPISARDNQ